jgi:hypothetical protein
VSSSVSCLHLFFERLNSKYNLSKNDVLWLHCFLFFSILSHQLEHTFSRHSFALMDFLVQNSLVHIREGFFVLIIIIVHVALTHTEVQRFHELQLRIVRDDQSLCSLPREAPTDVALAQEDLTRIDQSQSPHRAGWTTPLRDHVGPGSSNSSE